MKLMYKIKLLQFGISLMVALSSGCVTSLKPCQVDRIANEHNADLQIMLDKYPKTTMDLLHTIAVLEQETGHYK